MILSSLFSCFWNIIFLRDHNGNKAVQLFCAILVAIDFLIAFRHSITTLSLKKTVKSDQIWAC